MALQMQSPASHNRMLGQRIQHPLSTNFQEEEGFTDPPAKRLKRLDSTATSASCGQSEDDDCGTTPSCGRSPREIPDSEADDEDDQKVADLSRQTELERALPSIKTDKAAIADYEATRAAEVEFPDFRGRLGQRKWVPGKSSIYVDAFNLALETVLEDESHLFDKAEMAVFEHWKNLSYEGQYL
jgi:fanconi-associated nuclease 1